MNSSINNYFTDLKNTFDSLNRNELKTFINILLRARDNDNNIFIMGNGGSAATASHFACDFNKGMSLGQEKRFKLICLNDNIPTMLAYSNDLNYDVVFVEQLKNFMKKDDVVIGISGSGNSQNILNAVAYANSHGAITVGLTGYDGGKLKQIANYSINTNINNMQIAEDVHMSICHMMYDLLINQKVLNQKEISNV